MGKYKLGILDGEKVVPSNFAFTTGEIDVAFSKESEQFARDLRFDGIRILNQPRGTGKTTYLIYASSILDQPIIVPNKWIKEDLIQRAEQLHISMPEPMVLSSKLRTHNLEEQKVLVDEYPHFNQVLQGILNQMGIKINDDPSWIYNEELQLVRGLSVFGLRPSIITCSRSDDKQEGPANFPDKSRKLTK